MVDLVERVVDLVGVLEDHLHVTQELLALCPSEFREVLAPVEHLAAGGRRQPEQQARQRRLAAADLADHRRDGGRLVIDAEREIVERDHAGRPAEQAAAEDLDDVARFQQWRHAELPSYR